MTPQHENAGQSAGSAQGEVVDFDDALLQACPMEVRVQLLEEAALLMRAFAPEGRSEDLTAMASTLSAGTKAARPAERARARRLAAALRHLARAMAA